jgi:hypothetical protein
MLSEPNDAGPILHTVFASHSFHCPSPSQPRSSDLRLHLLGYGREQDPVKRHHGTIGGTHGFSTTTSRSAMMGVIDSISREREILDGEGKSQRQRTLNTEWLSCHVSDAFPRTLVFAVKRVMDRINRCGAARLQTRHR